MKISDHLDEWLADGSITPAQHESISAVVNGRRMSLYVELSVMLYLGVAAFAGGLAWTARAYSDRWGDVAILLPAIAVIVACFVYAFRTSPPYRRDRVESTTLWFDYVLYLGCLVLGVVIGYVEYRFGILETQWDYYLLASAAVYFAVAYRFDNRFVLSLALATLAAWFGVRLQRLDWFVGGPLRTAAVTYGIIVAMLGSALYRAGIKPHFVDAYLHVAVNVALAALAWPAYGTSGRGAWLIVAVVAAALSISGGLRFRRFAFVVYGAFYGYVAVSREVLRHVNGIEASLAYVVISAGLVVLGLVAASRQLGREE